MAHFNPRRIQRFKVTYENSLIQDNQEYIKKTCPKGEKEEEEEERLAWTV